MTSEILLSLLRRDVAGKRPEGIEKKLASASAGDLFGLAGKYGLFPVFYNKLSGLKLEALAEELASYKGAYIANIVRNTTLERRALEIIHHLKKYAIPVIPLKGPIFAKFIYGDLALRQASTDLDILVRPKDVKEAEERLKEIGYAANLDNGVIEYYHAFNNQIPLSRRDDRSGPVALDLHWDLRQKFVATNIDDFWASARDTDLGGYTISMPSVENIAMYLAALAILDGASVQIKYLFDLHTLVTRYAVSMNWGLLSDKAARFKMDATLFFALELCEALFNSTVPEGVLERIRPSFVKAYLVRRWVNVRGALRLEERKGPGYFWHYFVCSYIYSRNIFDFFSIVYKRTVLPRDGRRSPEGHVSGPAC